MVTIQLPIGCQLGLDFGGYYWTVIDDWKRPCCLALPILLVSVDFLRHYWKLVYLHGVLGVECSNHSVPTI